MVDVDVTDDASLDACFAALKDRWGGIDFLIHAIAFSDKNELTGRFINTTRGNFSNSLAISCFSFIDVSRRAAELMPEGGSLITLTYGGSNRVTPNYNVMGVAKAALECAVRYLANDLGPRRHPGQRDLARADEDAGGRGDRRARARPSARPRPTRRCGPTRRWRRSAARRSVALSDRTYRRLHHGRGGACRWRLSRRSGHGAAGKLAAVKPVIAACTAQGVATAVAPEIVIAAVPGKKIRRRPKACRCRRRHGRYPRPNCR